MSANNIQFTKVEIKLLKYIFKHYKNRYNARQLAKELSLNHAHVNKLCNSLSQKGLILKEEIGNSIYYTFNYKDELALKFIEYLLSLESKEFPKDLIILLNRLERFKTHIKMGLVFGSSIKGDKYNDIDILLMYDKKKSPEIERIKEDIRRSELVEKPIRYIDITENDIEKNKDDDIFYSIFSQNLVFHNPTKYVEAILKWLR